MRVCECLCECVFVCLCVRLCASVCASPLLCHISFAHTRSLPCPTHVHVLRASLQHLCVTEDSQWKEAAAQKQARPARQTGCGLCLCPCA